MRKIRVKKPDIKGFFQRVRNHKVGGHQTGYQSAKRTQDADSGKAQKQ